MPDINFRRTKTGLKVDFVLAGGEIAIEVKGTSRVDTRDLTALSAFVEEFSPKHAIVVCTWFVSTQTEFGGGGG